MKSVLLFVIAIPSVLGASRSATWTYTDPHTWPGICKTGERQSPINFDVAHMVIDRSTPGFEFVGYNSLHSINLYNTGKTLKGGMADTDEKSAWIQGGGLKGRYYLDQLHFHWAAENHRGSEHTLDDLHYPMELHLVHVKWNLSIEEALKEPDGLAVIGVLFKLGTNTSSFKQIEAAVLEDINPDPEHPSTAKDVHLDWFLPKNKGAWIRYEGSLTTPTCDEAVIWTIMTEPMFVTEGQLSTFRQLKSNDGTPLPHNYRDSQPLNGRKVYLRSLDMVCAQDASNSKELVSGSFVLIFLISTVTVMLSKPI